MCGRENGGVAMAKMACGNGEGSEENQASSVALQLRQAWRKGMAEQHEGRRV